MSQESYEAMIREAKAENDRLRRRVADLEQAQEPVVAVADSEMLQLLTSMTIGEVRDAFYKLIRERDTLRQASRLRGPEVPPEREGEYIVKFHYIDGGYDFFNVRRWVAVDGWSCPPDCKILGWIPTPWGPEETK